MTNEEILAELRTSVFQWREKAEQVYGRAFVTPVVSLELKGACAGLATRKEWKLFFNPALFLRDKAYFFNQCVPHELAHLLNFAINYTPGWPLASHGEEWKEVMRKLGVEPKRLHHLDTTGLVNRRSKPYTYQCGCRKHQLTETLHRRIQFGYKGRVRTYTCNKCGEAIKEVA